MLLSLYLPLFYAATATAQYRAPPTILGQPTQPRVPYTFRPIKIHSTNGSVENASGIIRPSGSSERSDNITTTVLLPGSSIVFDFGTDVGGYPVLDMAPSTVGQNATIRYTVSESFAQLVPAVGDASPLVGFASATQRYEVVTNSGAGERWIGRAIQGGQRFMLIEHINGLGKVALRDVGFEAATDTTPLEELPGSFNCSDTFLNDLWALGARTVQLGCANQGAVAPVWQVSGVGTLIESQHLAVHMKSEIWGPVDASLSLYIISGSTFVLNKGGNIYDSGTEFKLVINQNNVTLSRVGGSAIMLPPGSLTLGEWHKLQFYAHGDTGNATMSLHIDGVDVGSVPYDDALVTGPFGFTAESGTAIIVKDLLVQDTEGNVLYSNSMMSRSALQDFATGENRYAGCFDGAKRDRVLWAGDFSIFGGTIFYSTANVEAVAGSLLLSAGESSSQGQASSSTYISTIPSEVPSDDWVGTIFYSVTYAISAANAWYEWYQYTGDLGFVRKWWPAIKRDVTYCLSYLNATTGLLETPTYASYNYDYYDGAMPGQSTGTNSLMVWTLRNIALIADTLGEPETAMKYRTAASGIEEAVNKKLYNKTIGGYVVTNEINTGMSQDGNAYAVISGVSAAKNSPTSPQEIIQALRSLDSPYGPLAFSNSTLTLPIVSPYASGYHVWAAFEADMNDAAIDIMRKVWKNQVDSSNPYYTGMTWEFINGTTGEPYRPFASSQAHGWGSAPTWQLSRYVLGVSPATPGYSTWLFAPRTVRLTYANGRVPTPWGTIHASWKTNRSGYTMQVIAPAGTNGTIVIPGGFGNIVKVNGVNLATRNGTLVEGVRWAGAVGDRYYVNVTSNGGAFVVSII
ncbi:alpha-L-rhamnosidase [Ceratobasidium sp. AG-Ba]|nr:alpha-L-rhamnosidase [Ceratobasidium sp. AG-Ba]